MIALDGLGVDAVGNGVVLVLQMVVMRAIWLTITTFVVIRRGSFAVFVVCADCDCVDTAIIVSYIIVLLDNRIVTAAVNTVSPVEDS